MKKIFIVFMLFFIFSCDSPPVVITFVNDSSYTITVSPNPDTSQNWAAGIILPAQQYEITITEPYCYYVYSPNDTVMDDNSLRTEIHFMNNENYPAP